MLFRSMDVLVHGCHTVLFDLNYITNTVKKVVLSDFLNSLDITYNQFVQACILSGTDYNSPIKNSNFTNNIELIKVWGNIDNIFLNLEEINSYHHLLHNNLSKAPTHSLQQRDRILAHT